MEPDFIYLFVWCIRVLAVDCDSIFGKFSQGKIVCCDRPLWRRLRLGLRISTIYWAHWTFVSATSCHSPRDDQKPNFEQTINLRLIRQQ